MTAIHSYILAADSQGEKAPAAGKLLMVLIPWHRPKPVRVLRGELLALIPHPEIRFDGRPAHNFRSISDPSITLYGGDNQECVFPLNGKAFELLKAIQRPDDRFAEFSKTDKLEWGGSLDKGSQVYVEIPTANASVPTWSPGIVKYVGPIEPLPGRMFGVEIKDSHYCGRGNTDGFFGGYKYFVCEKNCGLFVSLDKLARGPPHPSMACQQVQQPNSTTSPYGKTVHTQDLSSQLQIAVGRVCSPGRVAKNIKRQGIFLDETEGSKNEDHASIAKEKEENENTESSTVSGVSAHIAAFEAIAGTKENRKQDMQWENGQMKRSNTQIVPNEKGRHWLKSSRHQNVNDPYESPDKGSHHLPNDKRRTSDSKVIRLQQNNGQGHKREEQETRCSDTQNHSLHHNSPHSDLKRWASSSHHDQEQRTGQDLHHSSPQIAATVESSNLSNLGIGSALQASSTNPNEPPHHGMTSATHRADNQAWIKLEKCLDGLTSGTNKATIEAIPADQAECSQDYSISTDGQADQVPRDTNDEAYQLKSESELDQALKQKCQLQQQINFLVAEKKNLQQKNEELVQEKKQCTQQAIQQKHQLQQQINFLLAEKKNLEELVQEKTQCTKNAEQQLQQQIENQKSENQKSIQQLAKKKREIHQLELQKQHFEAESERLHWEITDLQQRNQDLQQRLDSAPESHLTKMQIPRQDQDSWNVQRSEIVLQGKLGHGAWGSVCKGVFQGQKVAVKCAHEKILCDITFNQLKREIQIMAHVQHPNLVRLIAAVVDESVERQTKSPLLILELLDADLRSAYKKKLVDLRKEILLLIFRDVAYALHYLHEHQEPIIHRDVSAPNVLLQEIHPGVWRAKLSDFGSANLAKVCKTPGPGCIIYSAPEAFPTLDTPPKQTTKMDVYSYGYLLVESITKEMPSPQKRAAMLLRIKQEWAPMHDIITACTKEEPKRRLTMTQVLEKLHCNSLLLV